MSVLIRRCIPPAIGGSFLSALLATIALAGLFFLASWSAASMSPAPLIPKVAAGFSSGELGSEDYPYRDWRRGENQYNDCMVLQLAINAGSSPLEKALAPVFYVPNSPDSGVCLTLHGLITDSVDSSQVHSEKYARYWHGYVPVASALLRVTDLAIVRILLRAFVVLSVAMLLIASVVAGGALGRLGTCVSLAALLFWGLPYYGQALSFVPGDGLLLIGLGALIAWHRWLRRPQRLAAFCAAYGSLLAYFEFLTGQLPTGACLLFVAAFSVPPQRTGDVGEESRQKWVFAFSALLWFSLGAILSIVIKQLLVFALVGPDAAWPFVEHLAGYAGISNGPGGLLGRFFEPLKSLVLATPVLAYRSRVLAGLLIATTAVIWISAAWLAFRSGSPARKREFAAHLIGASGVVFWTVLLPVHTLAHAPFMVRMLIVPISLGWSALVGQMRPMPVVSPLRPRPHTRPSSVRTP